MISKIKKYFGIESVKIQIVELDRVEKYLFLFKLQMNTITSAEVESIEVELIEHYSLGRGRSKKNESYVLGHSHFSGPWSIAEDEDTTIEGTVQSISLKSPIDEIESKNILLKPAIRLAKILKGVNSLYELKVRGIVKGSAVPALASKKFEIK